MDHKIKMKVVKIAGGLTAAPAAEVLVQPMMTVTAMMSVLLEVCVKTPMVMVPLILRRLLM